MKEIDRLYRYKSLLSSRHAVSSDEFSQALNVSIATVKRDMASLRQRLGLPVAYDRAAGGYRLTGDRERRELPGMWLTPAELVALVSLQQLLAEVAPGWLSSKLTPLRERLSRLMSDGDLDPLQLAQRIRVVHAGQRTLPPTAFDTVASATLRRRRLWLRHYNRATGQHVSREVSPQQLVHYRDNWYLDAWCHLRDGLRSFAVDAIEQCRCLDEHPALEVDPSILQPAMQGGYGIFSGPVRAQAVLRFDAMRARWVSGERWHPAQTTRWLADGRFELTLPYSDHRELLGDILRHGSGCEVVAPDELRDAVQHALQAALRVYKGRSTTATPRAPVAPPPKRRVSPKKQKPATKGG